MSLTRSQKRQLLRSISEFGLNILYKGLDRKQRRSLGRVYSAMAYRQLLGLPCYIDPRLDSSLLEWVVREVQSNVG